MVNHQSFGALPAGSAWVWVKTRSSPRLPKFSVPKLDTYEATQTKAFLLRFLMTVALHEFCKHHFFLGVSIPMPSWCSFFLFLPETAFTVFWSLLKKKLLPSKNVLAPNNQESPGWKETNKPAAGDSNATADQLETSGLTSCLDGLWALELQPFEPFDGD